MNEAPETTIEPAVAEVELTPEQQIINATIAEQDKKFLKAEKEMATHRDFWIKHKDAMGRFYFYWWPWNNEIQFDCCCGITRNSAKEIARTFGVDGWKRKPDPSTCGLINWEKELDGVILKIRGAENIKPKLIEEVKLS